MGEFKIKKVIDDKNTTAGLNKSEESGPTTEKNKSNISPIRSNNLSDDAGWPSPEIKELARENLKVLWERAAPVAVPIGGIAGFISDVMAPLGPIVGELSILTGTLCVVTGIIWFGLKRGQIRAALADGRIDDAEYIAITKSNAWSVGFAFNLVASVILLLFFGAQKVVASNNPDKGAFASTFPWIESLQTKILKIEKTTERLEATTERIESGTKEILKSNQEILNSLQENKNAAAIRDQNIQQNIKQELNKASDRIESAVNTLEVEKKALVGANTEILNSNKAILKVMEKKQAEVEKSPQEAIKYATVFKGKDGESAQLACRVQSKKCMLKVEKGGKFYDGKVKFVSQDQMSSEIHLVNDDGRIATAYLADGRVKFYSLTLWKTDSGARLNMKVDEFKTEIFDGQAFFKSAIEELK